jgi:hypothetical protein
MASRPVLPSVPAAVTYRCEVRLRTGTVPGLAVRRRDCGQPAIGLFRSVCACGLHTRERHACRECVTAVDGTCALCWDEGHSCPVTITGPVRAAAGQRTMG